MKSKRSSKTLTRNRITILLNALLRKIQLLRTKRVRSPELMKCNAKILKLVPRV